MKLPFFSRRVRFFGNVAIMILCAVFFLVPFAFRGARMSLRTVRNDVADWLPDDFPETRELDWFRERFAGSQFVVISWPGCSEDDDRYHLLLDKIRAESLERSHQGEARLAHEIGDREGLHTTGDYHEEWGSHREKWLMGHHDQWYFITREGELYKWTGESNLIGWVKRGVERLLHGKNRAEGELVAQFGEPENNIYYKDPRRIAGRFFESVMTGPDLFNELAGPNGSLLRSRAEDDEGAALDAQILAHQRLTGLVFGPTPSPDFVWTEDAFFDALPEKTQASLPEPWRQVFSDYVEEVVARDFDGDRDRFLKASQDAHLEHWYRIFDRLRVDPPARQTCLVVTLNTDVAEDLSRVVGRPVLGKPRGRLLELASGEVLIPPEQLHLGGPPVDNVAIDEEGTITLMRLVSLSVLVGVALAYISFRSVNVTFMVFFIGSVSAVSSMGIVWYLGSSPDAVLMSMPALVYVLGLSGAIHIVNYYREAAHAHGPRGASEAAIRHGWFPCTLAAFTTSLGLISLYVSNLTPIQKFGLFSALGTMATVMLLFTYLPAALQIWPPGYKKQSDEDAKVGGVHAWIGRCWESICEFIIRRHAWVSIGCIVLMVIVGVGIFKIKTSVQLLKLFDKDAKVIQDYEWLEANLGRLVPMELVVRIEEDARFDESSRTDGSMLTDDGRIDELKLAKQLNFLERMELTARIRRSVEEVFGDEGAQIVGHGLSTDVFVLPQEIDQSESPIFRERSTISGQIEANYQQLLQTDTLRVDSQTGEELWRISLRLGAFNDVDYGRFVFDLKRVVEPIVTAYRHRNMILNEVYAARESARDADPESSNPRSGQMRVLLLGWANPEAVHEQRQPVAKSKGDTGPAANLESSAIEVDQTELYCDTLGAVLMNRGFQFSTARRPEKLAIRVIPENERQAEWLADRDNFVKQLEAFDCVVLIRDHELFDINTITDHAQRFIDARDHVFHPQPTNGDEASPTALEIRDNAELAEHNVADVGVTYTGIVPIVYKAQRTLLRSLMDSICLAFVMIAIVMMILLRDWKAKLTPANSLNISGGMISMLPNVFPVVMIFGAMGHMRVVVDIGSMMTASVAMGIAVDDTIHFMNWFRVGLREGLSRLDAIRLAYRRVATAMTQTTLIAGFGLSVFALSTFTPTQRFGVLMLTLLFAALIGDLIFLPALLAGPLGKFFALRKVKPTEAGQQIIAADMGAEARTVESVDAPQEVREVRRGTVGTPHLDGRASDKARNKSASPVPPGSPSNQEER